ncbi:MAG: family 20 glycosylhydrolase [Clostridia bacterium]|nr:family 20 glycosylhydrolase [Clostridia bacterium]
MAAEVGKINLAFLQQRVEETTGIHLPFPVELTEGPGLEISWRQGEAARIVAGDASTAARGLFRLSRALREGKTELTLQENRHYAHCGAMIDMSRNAVMKPEAVCRYIDHLSALGMNLLMLYTEDTVEVPGQPYFGYLRGRYTLQEMQQMDDYAAAMGVELIPCIQTLAHMKQFLQWPAAAGMGDIDDIYLIGEEKVYQLLETEIAALAKMVRSRRIHIGMDEAHMVGLGRYHDLNGETNRFQLLNQHLARVTEICEKNGLQPMMWSDMFFRLGSKTGNYYDSEAHVPEEVIAHLPQVEMVYWDYYHQEEETYDLMLKEHARMGRGTVFAGGNWTWSGFLPHVKRTEATMRPALRQAAKHRLDTVFATLWGDDGAETDLFLADGLLPLFSETCWQGPEAAETEIQAMGECLTGLPREVIDAWGDFYPSPEDHRNGKALIWGDPLLPLVTLEGDTWESLTERYALALRTLRPWEERLDCRYACALFEAALGKAELVQQLRPAYLAKDREKLSWLLEELIPDLIARYRSLAETHRALWERSYRAFGWEVMGHRYGGAIYRLEETAAKLESWLKGEIDVIEELEAEPLPNDRYQFYHRLISASVIV